MIGFAVLLANFGISIYYAPNIDAICPPWVYASFCFALFFYQIMDNIDGRQARRTGSSSPLGELVDHGTSVSVWHHRHQSINQSINSLVASCHRL